MWLVAATLDSEETEHFHLLFCCLHSNWLTPVFSKHRIMCKREGAQCWNKDGKARKINPLNFINLWRTGPAFYCKKPKGKLINIFNLFEVLLVYFILSNRNSFIRQIFIASHATHQVREWASGYLEEECDGAVGKKVVMDKKDLECGGGKQIGERGWDRWLRLLPRRGDLGRPWRTGGESQLAPQRKDNHQGTGLRARACQACQGTARRPKWLQQRKQGGGVGGVWEEWRRGGRA